MSFQKEEEVTQEKSNEQRIKELEDMVRFLVKEKKGVYDFLLTAKSRNF